MAVVGTVEAIASLDTSKYKRGAKEVAQSNKEISQSSGESSNSMSKLDKMLSGMAKAGLKVAAAGAVTAGAAISAMAVNSVKSYAALEQSIGGSEVVFTGFSRTVQEMAKKSAASMGTSMNQYLETANKMGSLFQGAGFSVRDSLSMTDKAMLRATDVATAMGISTDMALESIAGAAKGNFTMMDNLGVKMTATSIEAYALSKGFDKAYDSMTETEKVGFAMQQFMESTAKYTGNYAKENDTLAGSFTTLKATWGNFTAGVEGSGEELGTAMSGVFRVLGRELPGVFERSMTAFKGLYTELRSSSPEFKRFSDGVQQALNVARSIGSVLMTVGTAIYNMRVPLIALTVAWASYKLVMTTIAVITAINTAAMVANVTWLRLQTAAVMLARGATVAQTSAMLGLNLAMLANPIGLVIAALAGLTAALFLVSGGTKSLTADEQWLNQTRLQSEQISKRVMDAERALKDSRYESRNADLALERAEQNLTSAVDTYGRESLEAREAQLRLEEARERADAAKDKHVAATSEQSAALDAQRGIIQDVINKLDSLNGRTVRFTMEGQNAVAWEQDGKKFIGGEFATGGYTGQGGMNEPAGIVHKGEYVLPKRMVNQSTGLPKDGILGSGGGSGITNNIQNVTIASEVDGERWLRRLNGNQEIVSNGLVPTQSYMG